jgi:hypothetical protein
VVPPYDGQGIEQRLTAEAKRLRREKLRAHRSPTVSASPQATSGPRLQRKGLPGRPSPTVPTSHHAASPHLRQNAPPGRRSRLTISTPA